MQKGKGELVTKGGRRIALRYEFVETDRGLRAGHLLSDMRMIDPGIFCEGLRLVCEDGSIFDIAVINIGDRGVSFVGTPNQDDGSAGNASP